METIWVLENVKKNHSFYSKLQIWMLVASVSLWRKYHPNHKTVFYCDVMSHGVLSNLDLLGMWDEVRPLSYPEKINREIFWSSPKTKIISETEIPLLVIDHDFLIFKNIDEYLKDEVLYSYDERADNWYPPKNDAFNKKLSNPIPWVTDLAANVSLFYLPDPKFAQKYGKQTLQNHEELTTLNNPLITTNHMIMSEQFMLKQWLVKDNIPHNCLSKNLWDCKEVNFYNSINNRGIWDLKESLLYYKHYGAEETRIRENTYSTSYEDVISFLKRCIKAGKLIDLESLEEKIKVIKNV
jgi:hypothetical protein